VKSICPSILKKLVVPFENFPQFKNRPINNIGVYVGYLKNLLRGGKSAFREFLKKYTTIEKLSDDYKKWMEDSTQKELLLEVGITQNADPSLRKTRKKDPRLEELQKQFPDATLYDLEKQFFPSTKRQKQSLYEISGHMLAVNNNQNLNAFLKQGDGVTGKVAKGKAEKKKVRTVPLYAKKKKKMETEDNQSLRTFLLMNSFDKMFNPATDQELLCLLDQFVMPDSKSNVEDYTVSGIVGGTCDGDSQKGMMMMTMDFIPGIGSQQRCDGFDERIAELSQKTVQEQPVTRFGFGHGTGTGLGLGLEEQMTRFGPNEIPGLNDSMTNFSIKSSFI